ncbi:hypothetical protein [Burkholderia sp. Ax-1719]|uniref:hypothetical protein n=1 Tax=Burkholderia sp. Ax-1719 TaxID=2608334 RepID=UPI0014213538|nr:hypothetical protein [Burkholderia sp. Ax-1719]NIE63132.1 hypothetical protein [Burkholderia sp. Ax-1719]
MTAGITIYARNEKDLELFSFRESDLVEGIMSTKRTVAGTLYVPGELGKDFFLMPLTGEQPIDATSSPPLQLSWTEGDAGGISTWTADEAMEKTRATNQADKPVFIFVAASL